MKRLTIALATLISGYSYAQEVHLHNQITEANAIDVSSKLTTEESATDTLWRTNGNFGLNFSQVYLDNWAAGGQSSVSGTGFLSLAANYSKGKTTWDNTLDLAYGILRQGEAGDVIKTDDKIDFASKYGYKATDNWYYSGLLNFRTQFAPGYTTTDGVQTDDLISDFLSPAYLLAAAGLDYKPNENFTAFISPGTYKMTVVLDDNLADAGAFGVDAAEFNDLGEKIADGENIRLEIGGYLKAQYKTSLMENVDLQTKIDLFSNYVKNPQNIDVNWETLITMKINKYLTTTISTQLLYDDDIDVIRNNSDVDADGDLVNPDIGPAIQFKEVLSIGFSYKF